MIEIYLLVAVFFVMLGFVIGIIYQTSKQKDYFARWQKEIHDKAINDYIAGTMRR